MMEMDSELREKLAKELLDNLRDGIPYPNVEVFPGEDPLLKEVDSWIANIQDRDNDYEIRVELYSDGSIGITSNTLTGVYGEKAHEIFEYENYYAAINRIINLVAGKEHTKAV